MRTRVEAMLQELDQEADATRRVLERVPDSHLQWRPHERSFSLGQLAMHVATIPGAIASMSRQSPFEVPRFNKPSAASAAELVPALDASLASARAVLNDLDDADLDEPWRMVSGSHEILSLPVGALLRMLMLNHWYHHRGQVLVYLRQVGQPVPSVYGPTADENPFREALAAAGA
jgi:uncharacterized damage-inducible protein DinB